MAAQPLKGPADRRPIVRGAIPVELTMEEPVELTMAAAILVELTPEAEAAGTGAPIMVRAMAGQPPGWPPVWRWARCWGLCRPQPPPSQWRVRDTTMTAATITSPAIRALT